MGPFYRTLDSVAHGGGGGGVVRRIRLYCLDNELYFVVKVYGGLESIQTTHDCTTRGGGGGVQWIWLAD